MPQTRSSTKNSRERVGTDDRIESVTVHGDSATLNPDGCLWACTTTKGLEVVAKPGESSSRSTAVQEIVDRACSLEYASLKETNATKSDIDLSAQHLRWYIGALGPELFCPDDVDEAYYDLRKAISDFAVRFFPSVTWAQLHPDEQSKVKAWAPKAEQFMESLLGRQALFQAWLWHILDDNIFSANPSTKWQAVKDTMMPWHLMGQLMETFQNSDTNPFRSRAVKYYIWRALSADLALNACKNPHTMPPGYTAQLIRNELGHLIEETGVYLEASLRHVDAMSRKLDEHFMTRRFKTSVKWDTGVQPAGFPYSADFSRNDPGRPIMDVYKLICFRDPSNPRPVFEGQPVELVVAPALGIHGHGSQIWKSHMVADPTVLSWVKAMTVVVGKLPGPGEGDPREDL